MELLISILLNLRVLLLLFEILQLGNVVSINLVKEGRKNALDHVPCIAAKKFANL